VDIPLETPALRLSALQPRKEPGRYRAYVRRAVAWSVWLYVLFIVGVWLLLRLSGDRWWFATVILFGPRWLLAIPMLALLPMAAWLRRHMLWPLLGAGLVLLGPVLGLCVPWGRHSAADMPVLRVLTCNVDGEAVDMRALAALIEQTGADVVAIQECPAEFPGDLLTGWHLRREGQLLLTSRYPLHDVTFRQCRHPLGPWPPVNALYCRVESPWGPIGFCTVHLDSPRGGLDEVLDRWTVVSPSRSAGLVAKIENRGLESADLAEWLQGFSEPLIVAGDFNMPTDSGIYRRHWAGFNNAFSSCGFGFGYTKWTGVGRLQYGVRIDHVLTSQEWRCGRCWVERDIGSDHLPLIAEFTKH
jgi:vancomycin resistance protein VanJ